MAHFQRKLPSERTIAFAAAIISSKPADLSVREYIALLTRHVAKGRRENALSAAYRHLDRSAYWRAECERAKGDRVAAEEAKLDALREVDILRARLEAAKTASTLGSKRKRADADVVPYSREIKKGRKDAEEKREVFLGGLVIEEVDEDERDVGVQGLMRKLFQIGLYFKPGLQVHSKDLACHLCASAADICRVVLDALGQHVIAGSTSTSNLPMTITAAGRVVAGLLAGSQKLVRMESGDALTDQVTYALVRMYESLLTGFNVISKADADAEPSTEQAVDPKSLPANQKTKPKSKGGPARVNIKDIPALNALASLLSGIIKQLDAKQDSHRDIFEGFLFCIMSLLGNRVYTINFSHPRAATIAEEIEAATLSDDGSDEEDDLDSKPKHSHKSKSTPIPVRQAQLEAPYLLHLLKQSLVLTPSFLNAQGAGQTSSSKSTKSEPTPHPSKFTKTSLSLAAKERLQATLVNAIFGLEGVDEDSDLFMNCLQLPAAAAGGASAVTVPRIKEVEVGEWFQGEVWRLLGWEVLGKEMDGRGRG